MSEYLSRIHWIQGSLPKAFLWPVLCYLQALFGEGEKQDRGGMFYARKYVFDKSVRLYFDEEDSGRDDICVSVSGGACDHIGQEAVFHLVKFLAKKQFKASRLDCAVDDCNRSVSLETVKEAVFKCNFQGFLVVEPLEKYKLDGESLVKVSDGWCFGRRGSMGNGKYLRIYDKALESHGENSAIRWECEFSGKRSRTVFNELSSSLDQFHLATKIAALVGGCIDFRDRTGSGGHLDRMERLAWWELLLTEFGRIVTIPQRRSASMSKLFAWFTKQCGPSVAILRKYLIETNGGDQAAFFAWFDNLAKNCKNRLDNARLTMVREAVEAYASRPVELDQYV